MRATARLASHPLHPILIVFPLGLWIGSWIFDVLGYFTGNNLLWAAGFYCVIAGCVGAVLAAVAGFIDWMTVVPPRSSAKRRGLTHGVLNALVLAAFIFIAYRRGDPGRAPGGLEITISTIAIVALGISGWLGGSLVVHNQIGVDRRYANAGRLRERQIESWERPACNQSELSDGQMMLIRVNKERVVVARCSDGIAAFGDRCTHKGGPLSDGALIGCAVQCPWHGSQFDILTGRVIAGPAREKIEIYQVEVRAGEVFIRPRMKPGEQPRAA